MIKPIYNILKKPFIPEYMGVVIKSGSNDPYNFEFDGKVKEKIENYYEKNTADGIYLNTRNTEGKNFYLSKYDIETNSTAYHFFQINCEEDTDIVMVHWASSPQKVWVNYNYYSYLGSTDIVYTIHLKNGINTIVLETLNATPRHNFFIRISSLEYEESSEYSFIDGKIVYSRDYGRLCRNSNFLFDKNKEFRFIFFPNNDTLVTPQKTGTVKIYKITLDNEKETKEIILENSILPFKKYTYDFSKYECDLNSFTYFYFELSYEYTNGRIHRDDIDIFTYYPEKGIERLCRYAEEYANLSQSTDYDKLCVKQYIGDLNKYPKETTRLSLSIQFYKKFQKALSAKCFDDEICSPGFKEIFYYSENFEDISSVHAYIPPKYTPNKKYPLIILTTTNDYLTAYHFSEYTAEDVIAIDVSLRGITLGSYVGDAALWEAVSEIEKYFSIDEERVYITGYSNGGGASILQGQLHPDKFAGIYPFSAGGANKTMAMNLLNTKVITVSSPTESRYTCFQLIDEALKNVEHPDYTGILIDNFTHVTLMWIWVNKRILEKLLEGRNDKYPKHIKYHTFRNRCRKAYWCEIHSIEYGKLFSEIEAEIKDGNIHVALTNATGITITLPPQITKAKFEITVNNQIFSFENYNSDTVVLVNNGNQYKLSDTYEPITDLHKGNGLLDVYLDPLAICVPTGAAPEGIIYKSAVKFSNPITNGYDPKVYVSYPVVTTDSIQSAGYLDKKSMIVFDDLSDDPILNTIRQNAKISVDTKGYEYNGNRFDTNYCIMQIVKNPWNPNRNIVLVSSNPQTTLSKNFFIRNVVLPTYIHDYHPYWNNDALIFTGKEYTRILEFGMDIEKIT